MPEYYTFECGCKFEVIDKSDSFPKIKFSPKAEEMDFHCKRTWELISDGNTKGCFQLESRLGQTMAKKLKPENIEQLAGLISILRPGCLEAIREGKSVSNHYIDKKNGQESIDYFHTSLEKALKSTYGEMIYQEQAMEIAQTIAGFDLKEADMLRKAIGKKKPEEMAKVKKKFIEGCKSSKIVNESDAEEIFGWIEKSQRYSFNKSHAVSYAINAYLSAYAKSHFPKIFFASYLRFAKDKIDPQQEIKELVRNANEMNIDVSIPDFRLLNEFFILHNKSIYFGLTDIKGVGKSVYKKMIELVNNEEVAKLNWLNILTRVLLNINSIAAKALISCGAFDYFHKNRTEMLFEYEILASLTKKELESFINLLNSNEKCLTIDYTLKELISYHKFTKNRVSIINNLLQSIKNPPYSLIDKIEWLSDSENSLLGASITCSKLDTYDISMTNCNCKTFKTSIIQDNIIIAGEISNVNLTKTKTGKNPGQEMAFVSIEDQNGILDSVIFFPEQLAQYKHHLYNNNILIFCGSKSKSRDGLIVQKCFMPLT
jgi:DNA polymerase-3 subunit alpha